MAQIDIERKSEGAGWIWWVVGLIIVALLAWWVISSMGGDDRTTAATDTAVATPVTDAGFGATGNDMVTDLSMLTDPNNADLAGRRVALTSAPVLSAVSDKGFWVGQGTDATQSLFVVRGDQDASYTAPDGAVGSGKQVNVWGTVQAMPSDLNQQTTAWNLSSTDASRLATQKYYVQADSVRIAGS